jgi:CubicO group peptidase (beta-lactamase class C family)
MKHFVLFLLLISIPALAAENQPGKGPVISIDDSRYESIAEKFDSLFHLLSAKRGFNGNVLVAQQGNIIYEKTFGYSDIKRKTPLNIKSAFQIASVSKQFTAMAVMILFDEKKLDFDDSVQKYFPEFPYEGVTIRHLLSHRSGLPNYLVFSKKYWNGKNRFMTNRDLMDMLVAYKPRCEFEPDRTFKYSNTGYAVLCSIIEKVSGMQYDAFMEENIFKPLEMNNTFVYNQKNKKTIEFITRGYTKRNRPFEDGYLSGVYGDKGIYSTVEDLLKWDQVLYTNILVKQETLEKAFTPNSYDYRNDTEYGFGWRIETLENGEKIVYHTGFWGGYNSLFARRLSDHTAIVILSNRINWSFNNISRLMKLVDSPDNT